MWWQISAAAASVAQQKTKAIFQSVFRSLILFLWWVLHFKKKKKKDEEEARPGRFEAICIFKEVMESFFRVLPWLIWKMLSKSSSGSFDGSSAKASVAVVVVKVGAT